MINSTTATITLKMDKSVEGVQNFYSDLNMISKHYLVTSKTQHKINRMYTICNCLRPEAYKYYLTLVKSKL
jgi:hypothetical protein